MKSSILFFENINLSKENGGTMSWSKEEKEVFESQITEYSLRFCSMKECLQEFLRVLELTSKYEENLFQNGDPFSEYISEMDEFDAYYTLDKFRKLLKKKIQSL